MVVKVRKSKKVVTVALVRDAVAALSERNGSSVKSIFNYLVWERQANSDARKQVVLAIRKAAKAGVLVRKNGKGFVVPENQLSSKPARKSGKRKASEKRRTLKKSSSRSTRARRAGQIKRKARKSSKVRKLPKKVETSFTSVARKPVWSRKGNVSRKRKSANSAKSAPKMSARSRRKCTVGVRYTT